MSHDYQPSWDYPVVTLDELKDLTAEDLAHVHSVLAKLESTKIAETMGFTQGIEIFYVEPMGLTTASSCAVGIYCNGTSARPVIGVDLVALKEVCTEEDLHFGRQLAVTIAHELGHAYQDSLGQLHEHLGADHEDEAESFGLVWADTGRIELDILKAGQAHLDQALADLVVWREHFAASPQAQLKPDRATDGQCDQFARVFSEHLAALNVPHTFCVISRKTYRGRRVVDKNLCSHCIISVSNDADLDANGLDASSRWEEDWYDQPGEETTFAYRSFPDAQALMKFLSEERKGYGAPKSNPDDPEMLAAWGGFFEGLRVNRSAEEEPIEEILMERERC